MYFFNVVEINLLLTKLDTFKHLVCNYFSLFWILWWQISVNLVIQFLLFVLAKTDYHNSHNVWQYWYDMKFFIQILLTFSKIIQKMHFDMIVYIDCFIKLWYSRAWEFSIYIISDDYVYFFQDNVLFLKYFVKMNFVFLQKANYYAVYNHIIFFDCNCCSSVQVVDDVILTLKTVLSCHTVNEQCQLTMTSINNDEYLLMKNCMFEISTFIIKHKIALIISCFLSFLSQSCNIIIHNILNLKQKKLWLTTKLYSLQAEFKITHYDQQHLKLFASSIQ